MIERLLVQDEGLKLEPYRDHLGFWTVGVGHLIDRRKGGELPAWIRPSFPITEAEAMELLRLDVSMRERALEQRLSWFATLDEVRKTVLLSMAFQLGVEGLLKFRDTLRAVSEARWGDAANAMRNSGWHSQTTARAERLAVAMYTGDVRSLKLRGGSDA